MGFVFIKINIFASKNYVSDSYNIRQLLSPLIRSFKKTSSFKNLKVEEFWIYHFVQFEENKFEFSDTKHFFFLVNFPI